MALSHLGTPKKHRPFSRRPLVGHRPQVAVAGLNRSPFKKGERAEGPCPLRLLAKRAGFGAWCMVVYPGYHVLSLLGRMNPKPIFHAGASGENPCEFYCGIQLTVCCQVPVKSFSSFGLGLRIQNGEEYGRFCGVCNVADATDAASALGKCGERER